MLEQEVLVLVLVAVACFGVVSLVGIAAAYYNATSIEPRAAAQMEMFEGFTCEDWSSFSTQAVVYSKKNRDYMADKKFSCSEAKRIAKEKADAKLNALLADPNSFESLKRDEKKYGSLLNETLKNHTAHINGIGQLETLIDGYNKNLTLIKNKLNEGG